MGREGVGKGREWMRRGRKSSQEREQWICSTGEGGRMKVGESSDEKIVMVKLIVQKEKKKGIKIKIKTPQ
jgi:hypothetical protein